MRGLGMSVDARGVRLAEFGFFVTAAALAVILSAGPVGAQTQTYDVATGTEQTVATPITDGAAEQTSVIKNLGGTLVFGAANTYTGATTVNAGTLALGAAGSISSSSVNLAGSGAIFDVSAASNPVIQDLSGVTGTTVSLGANTLTFGTGNSTNFAGTISGAGGLFKEGGGTTTLNGANTFSGGVFIDDGTLALGPVGSMVSATGVFVNGGAAGFSIANAGNQTIQNLTAIGGGSVALGANTLTIDNTGGASNFFAGVISGTGGIVVTGNGTLTINDASTYTGSTVVNNGTLALGGNGSIASSSGLDLAAAGTTFDISSGTNQTIQALSGAAGSAVNLGAFTLTVGGSGSTTFAGTIQGSTPLNGLTKQGSGTLTLTGNETYIGPTTIKAGTLALGPGGSILSSSGVSLTASGATLDISTGGSQVIQDLAGVGGSAVTLGANRLTLGTSRSTIFAGNISGAGGGLVKQGTGMLTLSGTNSYTGGTTISAGTLSGTTSSLQGDIIDNGSLVFNQPAAGTYAGSLSGNGTLSLQGGGAVTLTGDSAGFTGTTNVSSGDLAVGSAASPGALLGGNVAVTSGGAVSGHGTIGGDLTNTSGIVAPGGSVGTLSVAGNYTQGPDGKLAVQLTPAGASQLAVAGTVSLQGSLDILSGPNGYVPFSRYTILTAGGGISGTFQSVGGSPPVIPLSVVYDANDVYLQLSGFAGATPNENAVASVLNSHIAAATGDFLTMLNLAVVLPPAQMEQTLSSLGGQIYGDLGEVSLQDRMVFLEALTDRTRTLGGAWPANTFGGIQSAWGGSDNALKLAQLGSSLSAHDQQIMSDVNSYSTPSSGPVGGVWAKGFGQFGKLDSNSGALGSSYATGGGIIGADIISNAHTIVGVAASGGQSSASLSTNPENGTISFFQGGVYGARLFDNGVALDGSAIYAHDIYDVSRGIVLPGASRTASSTHGGDDEVAAIGLGRTFFYNDFRVLPRAEVSYFHIGQSDFSETGAGSLDLSVTPADLNAFYSRVGVTLVKPILLGTLALVPELRAAWLHNFLDNNGRFSAAFAGAPTATFSQLGAPMGHDAGDVGAGVSFGIVRTSFGGELSGFVQYEAWVAAHELASAVGAGVRLNW